MMYYLWHLNDSQFWIMSISVRGFAVKLKFGAGRHNGNALDSNSGDAGFELRCEHPLSLLRFYRGFFSVPPENFLCSISVTPRQLPSKFLPVHIPSYHSILRSVATDSAVRSRTWNYCMKLTQQAQSMVGRRNLWIRLWTFGFHKNTVSTGKWKVSTFYCVHGLWIEHWYVVPH